MKHSNQGSTKLIRLSALIAAAVSMAGLLACATAARAQATQHFGSQTTVVTSTAGQNYIAIAMDSSGNLYLTDQNDNEVLKETLSGGVYTQSVLVPSGYSVSTGVKQPEGIAVDASGDVFIADVGNARLLKETPAGGGTYTQTVVYQSVVGSFVNPYGVALDSSGDVFVSGESYNSGTSSYQYHIFEFTPAAGNTYTETVLTVAGLLSPAGLAVDSSNNLYIADENYPRVTKGTVAAGVFTQTALVVDDSSFNWLDVPVWLAVDNNGNVFVTNPTSGGYDADTVIEAVLYGGGYHYRIFGAGFSSSVMPYSVATDTSGNVFVAVNLLGSAEVLKISTPTTNLGSVNVGSTSAVFSMPFTFSSATTFGQTGAANSAGGTEFVDTGTGTCDTGGASKFYAAGASCTVNVTFSPKYAGLRQGVVQVVNDVGIIIAEQFITGTGIAPQVSFAPATVTSFGSALSAPTSVAVDGKGVVYVADGGTANEIYTETPSGSTYTQSTLPTSQFGDGQVYGVTVDGGDNVSFGYTNGGFSYVVQAQPQPPNPDGGGFVANNGEGSALNVPKGIAEDGAGNIYIVDSGNNRVVEVLYSSGSNFDQPSTWQLNVATGLNGPTAVAVDPNGIVYIADTGNNRVLKEVPSSVGVFTQSVAVSTGLSAPAGVAVDNIGNLYVSDTGNKRVLKEAVSGSTYTQSVVLSTGLASPQGLTLDSGGNLYIADATNKLIYKVAQGTAPSLTFASTAVGSTSSDSPQAVTLSNIGTAALTFPIPGTGNNPSISTNFILSSTGGTACPLISSSAGSPGTLAANASCTLPISFVPTTSGTLSGSLVLTDNTLNVSASTQSISLNGTGTSLSAPVAGLSPLTVPFTNTPVGITATAQNITLSNTGNAALTISSVTIGGTNPGDFAIYANNCGSSLATTSTCTISVTFTPATAASFTATLSVTDNATGSPQTVALTGTGTVPIAGLSPSTVPFSNTPVGTTATAQNITLSNTGGAPLTISSVTIGGTNPSDFAISANNCGSSLAATSTCTISVTFTPASATSFAATLSVTDNATGSPQTVTLTGTGTAPQASLSPTTVPFANTSVGSTATAQNITLSNAGNAALSITSVTIGGANPTDFAISANTCGSSLAASSTCTISVTFTPASAASFTATLSVADNATGSPQTVSLTGTGTTPLVPQAVLTPTTVSFATTAAGSTATAQGLTLSNPGTAALSITSVALGGTNPTDFAISANTCGSSLAAGGTCTISVTFTPASAASFAATLSVVDNATGSPQTAALSGTGTTSVSNFALTSSPASLTVPGGSLAQFTITAAGVGGSFNSPVVLSVSGLPTGTTSSFAPPTVTPGSTGANSILSIQTLPDYVLSTQPQRPGTKNTSPIFVALLLLPLLGIRRLRKRLARLPRITIALLFFAACGALALTGCGGGYYAPQSHTYALTITGQSGITFSTTSVSLTVQ